MPSVTPIAPASVRRAGRDKDATASVFSDGAIAANKRALVVFVGVCATPINLAILEHSLLLAVHTPITTLSGEDSIVAFQSASEKKIMGGGVPAVGAPGAP